MHGERFEAERPRLEALAYGMLGVRADAEDVVQDAWLRWQRAADATIDNPGAWLTTVVTRLAIDRLRSARREREVYVGPWLPEPVVVETASTTPRDPADVVVIAETFSLAFLTALERLDPVERAVLLLREGFDLDYAEIAPIVDRRVDNCRQLARRARDRVAHRARPRGRAPADEVEVLEQLLDAVVTQDLPRVRSLLAADVVAWSDGGGVVSAARRPVLGADAVARFLVGLARQGLGLGVTTRVVSVNGDPGLVVVSDHVELVAALEVVDGAVVAMRNIRVPAKLARVAVDAAR